MSTAAGRVPVEIVQRICARIYELHGTDMVERAAAFRIFHGAAWRAVMEDVRQNTPRYTLTLAQPPYGTSVMHLYLPNCDIGTLSATGRPMFAAEIIATARRRARSIG